MKCLMSINNKFMGFTPKELIELLKNKKCVEGFELFVNYYNEFEVDYLHELAHQCKINNLLLQIHSNINMPVSDQISYMKILENISDILGYKIHVVLHSISTSNIEESKTLTEEYFKTLTDNIDNNKLIISMENLNNIVDMDRLGKDDIVPLICNNENVFFTYDMGHEIVEYGKLTDLKPYIIPLLSNIHLHTFSGNFFQGYDHQPISKDSEHWNEVIKSLLYLKSINYQGNIVMEYDLFQCRGEFLKDKILSYADSMELIYNHIN